MLVEGHRLVGEYVQSLNLLFAPVVVSQISSRRSEELRCTVRREIVGLNMAMCVYVSETESKLVFRSLILQF